MARQPGLARALAQTLQEVRLAGARPAGDLGRLLEAYEAELARAKLADRAEVFRLALEVPEHPLLGLPALLLDLAVASAVEERFLSTAARRGAGHRAGRRRARGPPTLARAGRGSAAGRRDRRRARSRGCSSGSSSRASRSCRRRARTCRSSPRRARAASASRSRGWRLREAGARRAVRSDGGAPARAVAVPRATSRRRSRRAGVPAYFARGTRAARPGGARVPRAARVRGRGALGARASPSTSRSARCPTRSGGAPPSAAAARRSLGAARRRADPCRWKSRERRARAAGRPRRSGRAGRRRHAARAAAVGAAPRRGGGDRRPRAVGDSASTGSTASCKRSSRELEDEATGGAAAPASRGDLARCASSRCRCSTRSPPCRARRPGAAGSTRSPRSPPRALRDPSACSRCSASWRRWRRSGR